MDNGILCFSDSLEYLDNILEWIKKYNMKAIIDIHAWKDSQNGFDNSGQTKNMEYYKVGMNESLYFRHWDIRNAGWIGDFDIIRKIYTKINYDNIIYALKVIELVLLKYKDYDMVWGLSPMNEPWEYTPEEELKKFYKNVYDKFNLIWSSNQKVLIFHDSFRPYLWNSCSFLGGNLDNIYLDTHQYIAWNEAVHFETLISSIRNWNYPQTCLKVIVGEFSLATDNCMMWLNGFMDNIQNYPLHTCFFERCPLYNENNNILYIKNSKFGPFGTGISSPTEDGYCPYTTPISLNKLIYNGDNNQPIIISPGMGGNNDPRNIDKVYVSLLFQEFIRAFESKTNGWLFWNFKTESESYSWNYLSAYNLGYIRIFNLMQSTNKSTKSLDKSNLYYIFVFVMSFLISFGIGYLIYSYCLNNNYTLYRLTNLKYQYKVLDDDRKRFFIRKRDYTNGNVEMNTFNV
jgi:glucan 1,3-beta-glucosidase